MCGRVVIIIKKHYNVVGSGNVSVFNDNFFFDWGEGENITAKPRK